VTGLSERGIKTFTDPNHPERIPLNVQTAQALAVNQQQTQMWVGTRRRGILTASRSDITAPWTATQTYDQNDGLPGCSISAIEIDDDGRVFAVTNDGTGAALSVRDTAGTWHRYAPPESWPKQNVFIAYDLALGDYPTAWVATHQGLFAFESKGEDGAWLLPVEAFQSLNVKAVQIERLGSEELDLVWAGTKQRGLVLFQFTSVAPVATWATTAEGLLDNHVEAIALLPHLHGALVGTGAGLNVCQRPASPEQPALACKAIVHPNLTNEVIYAIAVAPNYSAALVGLDQKKVVHLPSTAWETLIPAPPGL
jgi:ligand-binding sensor domain-containing protein